MNGGDLRFHIYNIGPPGLEPARVRFYAAEVCCGLHHLHQMNIVYRSVDTGSVLILHSFPEVWPRTLPFMDLKA
jgi:G protein-coupled receptor kinase